MVIASNGLIGEMWSGREAREGVFGCRGGGFGGDAELAEEALTETRAVTAAGRMVSR